MANVCLNWILNFRCPAAAKCQLQVCDVNFCGKGPTAIEQKINFQGRASAQCGLGEDSL